MSLCPLMFYSRAELLKNYQNVPDNRATKGYLLSIFDGGFFFLTLCCFQSLEMEKRG